MCVKGVWGKSQLAKHRTKEAEQTDGKQQTHVNNDWIKTSYGLKIDDANIHAKGKVYRQRLILNREDKHRLTGRRVSGLYKFDIYTPGSVIDVFYTCSRTLNFELLQGKDQNQNQKQELGFESESVFGNQTNPSQNNSGENLNSEVKCHPVSAEDAQKFFGNVHEGSKKQKKK